MRPAYLPRQIWAWPLALTLLTLLGLALALFDDGGPLDAFAWFALGMPVAVCVWFGWCKRGTR